MHNDQPFVFIANLRRVPFKDPLQLAQTDIDFETLVMVDFVGIVSLILHDDARHAVIRMLAAWSSLEMSLIAGDIVSGDETTMAAGRLLSAFAVMDHGGPETMDTGQLGLVFFGLVGTRIAEDRAGGGYDFTGFTVQDNGMF